MKGKLMMLIAFVLLTIATLLFPRAIRFFTLGRISLCCLAYFGTGGSSNPTLAAGKGNVGPAVIEVASGDELQIPFYDVDRYCRYPQNNYATTQCIRSEQLSYDALKSEWIEMTPATQREALEAFQKYRTTRYSGAEGIAHLLLEKQQYYEGMRQTPPSFQR